eukprot:CAMPEP_0185798694 /NCGR_PEP_ID=MMETSP1174-20130828/162283_1 /TAXON_ID=35687 /ORGANISM="Dictyocha speculum, Strain CCMP1381" /LENGTH=104 /DNA_ID=CAMNT_0028494207 /DNA_START=121 /DNA_END=435 /DNA_ORIENTATION=+
MCSMPYQSPGQSRVLCHTDPLVIHVSRDAWTRHTGCFCRVSRSCVISVPGRVTATANPERIQVWVCAVGATFGRNDLIRFPRVAVDRDGVLLHAGGLQRVKPAA